MAVRREPELWQSERVVLAPPERLTVSEWADRYRHVAIGPRAGQPWETSWSPFLREPMDCFNDDSVEQITLLKAPQVGGSEVLQNVLGYVIDQEPEWVLYVLPRDIDARDFCRDRARPMVEQSKQLLRHVTNQASDLSVNALRFDRAAVFFATADSPAALASKPCRIVMLDEVDKYPPWSGAEADPIALAKKRTRNFANRKVYVVSTPTTREGAVFQEWERSDKRHYHMPCPHCGAWQQLVWTQVRFPQDVRNPDDLRMHPGVSYHCVKCDHAITDAEKRVALRRGVWVPEGAEVTPEGLVVGARKAAHRGYHVHQLLSFFVTWGALVAEWLEACRTPAGLQDWYNGVLGQPFEERVERTTFAQIAEHVEGYGRGTVPDGALVLTAGVDRGKRDVHYEVRAWGPKDESWLVQAGKLETLPELENVLIRKLWPFASGRSGLQVRIAGIDEGYETDETHAFVRRFPEVLRAVKGEDSLRGSAVVPVNVERDARGTLVDEGLRRWLVDTSYFKDKIARLIRTKQGEKALWHVHAGVQEDWLQQIVAEQKVAMRGRNGHLVERWSPVPGAGPNHYLDACVYSFAAAHMLGVHLIEDAAQAAEPAPRPGSGPIHERERERRRGAFGHVDRGGGRRGVFGR